MPRFSFLQHKLVQVEIQKLMLMFRYLHRTALAQNQDQCLKLFIKEGWYEGAGRREYLPEGIQFAVLADVYGPPSSPSQKLEKAITYKDDSVLFYAHGAIQAGTIYLTDKNREIMYALSTAIAPIAHIRVYKYDALRQGWIAL